MIIGGVVLTGRVRHERHGDLELGLLALVLPAEAVLREELDLEVFFFKSDSEKLVHREWRMVSRFSTYCKSCFPPPPPPPGKKNTDVL